MDTIIAKQLNRSDLVRSQFVAHNAIRNGATLGDAHLDVIAHALPGAHVASMSFCEAREVLRDPTLAWPAGAAMAKLIRAG